MNIKRTVQGLFILLLVLLELQGSIKLLVQLIYALDLEHVPFAR